MSLQQLKAFLVKVQEDSRLQEKLKRANSPEDVERIAAEHGHKFTAEHITELTDQELEDVSGGTGGFVPPVSAMMAKYGQPCPPQFY